MRRPFSVILVPVLTVAAAAAFRVALSPLLGGSYPYVTFYVAVSFAASCCSTTSSLATMLLGFLTAICFFVPSSYAAVLTEPAEIAGAAGYLFVSLSIIAFSRASRIAERRAREKEIEARLAQEAFQRTEGAFTRTETELEKHRRILGTALDAAFMGTWEYSIADGVCELGPRAQKLYGLPDRIWVGTEENVQALLHPDDIPAGAEALRKACDPAGDGRYAAEYRVRLPEGGWRWLSVVGLTEFEGEGSQRRAVRLIGSSRDISSTKRAEEALRESEARFRTMADGLPFIIWVHDAAGNLAFVNKTYCEFFGVTEERVLGGGWQPLLHPDDAQNYVKEFFACIREKRPFHASARVQTASGEWRWIESSGRVHLAPNGEFLGMVGTSPDVTERKLAEEQLRRTSERLALFADTAGRLLAAANPQDLVEDLCRRVMEHLRCELFFNYLVEDGETLALNVCEGISPEEAHKIERLEFGMAVCGCAAREQVRVVVEDVQHSSDERVQLVRAMGVQAYCCHPLVAGSRLLGTLSFGAKNRPRFDSGEIEVMRVVADQVAVAMERIRNERSVRDKELFYRQILESIPGMVFTTRADGYCDYQSRQWETYTGVPAVEHLGDGWNKLLHPADQGGALEAWRAAVEEGAPYDLEYRVRRHDGCYEWFKVIGRPLRDASGQIARWFGTALNIESLKRAQEALEEAARRKDEFIAMLAHELRNPMAAIGAAANLLLRPNLKPEKAEITKIALKQRVSQLARHVDDLLDMSRITRGKIELKKENLELGEVIARAVESVRACFEDCEQELTVQISDLLPTFGDPVRLEQIVVNLLRNASRYSEHGQRVILQAFRDREDAVIRVKDRGIGIPGEFLPRIFEPFAQGEDNLARSGGLGLGLTIVKSLCEMHHGSVSVKSEGAGRGSEFEVRIPLGEGFSTVRDAKQDVPSPGSLRILLVEDHADTAVMQAAALELEGHSVELASNGAAAVELGLALKPEVILLDIGLPGLNGYEVAKRLRAGGLANTTIIALTGYGQERDILKAHEAGIDHHLLKPIDYEQLARLLSMRFKKREAVFDA